MKFGRIFLALVLTVALGSKVSKAQTPDANLAINQNHYKTAVGVIAGYPSGISFKQFYSGMNALEVIAGFHGNAIRGTFLLEKHVTAGPPSLHWYYGFGAHAAFWVDRPYYETPWYPSSYREGEIGLGVDAVLGIEYKIPPIPFAVSFDVKPLLEVTTDGDIAAGIGPGLGIKVTF